MTTTTVMIRIESTFLPVEESTEFLWLWWDSHVSFRKHISALKTQCKEVLNLWVDSRLKLGGDRDTLLMLHKRLTKLPWRNVGRSCLCITIWKSAPVLTTQHIMPYLKVNQPQGVCIFRGQMEDFSRYDLILDPAHWSQIWGSHGLCKDQCRIGLPLENNKLSIRNTIMNLMLEIWKFGVHTLNSVFNRGYFVK